MDTSPQAPIVVESLRPGVFVDTAGVEHRFSRADLEQIAADYDPSVFRSPVVIGHPKINHPAWGWIDGATVGDDDRLRVEFSAVDPAFATAVQKKHYTKVSLALFAPATPGNPTPGKWYIRHLGYLGGAAPAITGLAGADFAGPVEGVVEFANLGDTVWSLSRLARNLREWLIGQHGVDTADRVIPSYQVEELEAAARDGLADNTPQPLFSAPPAPTQTQEVLPVTEEEAQALRTQNAALQAQLTAAQNAAAERAAAERESERHAFAAALPGKVPTAQQPVWLRVWDATTQIAAPVEFAAPDGTTQRETVSQALRGLVAGLPQLVPVGEAAGGAEFAAPSGTDAGTLAREAQALMAAAARNGRSLDSAAAVAEVQARRAV